MITFIQIVLSILLLFGCFFILVGALGLVKLSTFFKRLHAPTKASTLGVGCVLVASGLWFAWQGKPSWHELLITLFLFITAPMSANMIAKVHLHRARTGDRPDHDGIAGPPPRPDPDGEGEWATFEAPHTDTQASIENP